MIYASDIIYPCDLKKLISETELGIESIEFSISDHLDHLQEKIREYKVKMVRDGIKELTLHGPFLDLNPAAYDSQIQKVTMRRFSETYEAACQVGAKKIIYHTGFIPSVYYLEGWAERMAEFMNHFLEKRTEVEIVMENVYDKYPDSLMKVKELVKYPNFSLCLDVGHVQCYSQVPVMEWIECLGKEISHVHLHDNDGTRDVHLALGKGKLPVEKMLERLKTIIPQATYTIECTAYEDVIATYNILKEFEIK